MDLVGLGFVLPVLLALGFALVAALLADGLARDACAPGGFGAALVPGLLVARPVLAGAALRLLDSVPPDPAAFGGAAALPFVIFPFAGRRLEREALVLDVFLLGLLVVAKAFRLQRGVADGLPLSR